MSVLPIQNVSFTKSKMSVLHNKTESHKRHERKRCERKNMRKKKKGDEGFFHKIRPNAEGRINDHDPGRSFCQSKKHRAGSSLGSARIWAREPGVLRSSARSSQAFWKLGQARGIIFLARTFSEARTITKRRHTEH